MKLDLDERNIISTLTAPKPLFELKSESLYLRVLFQLLQRHVEHLGNGLVLVLRRDGEHAAHEDETGGEEAQCDTHHRPLGLLTHLVLAGDRLPRLLSLY